MALSVVDIYRNMLPKTNCGDCGSPTCFAFAGKVVSKTISLDTQLLLRKMQKGNRLCRRFLLTTIKPITMIKL